MGAVKCVDDRNCGNKGTFAFMEEGGGGGGVGGGVKCVRMLRFQISATEKTICIPFQPRETT